MTLLLLEALGAGLLFIGIIWWTMFSGRKHGELPTDTPIAAAPQGTDKGDAQQPLSAERLEENSR